MGDTGSLVARRRAGRLRDPDPHRVPAGHPRRPVRDQTLSVILQVGYFKARPSGRAASFRMAPLQHHFELLGLGRDHHRDPVLDHHRASASPPASASSTPSGSPAHERRRPRRASGRHDRLGRRPRRRGRLRRLRLRRRRQPDPPRRLASPRSTSPTPATRSARRPTLLEMLGADGPARRGRDRDAARRRRPAWSPRPGWPPTAPLLAQAARPRRPGLGRGRARLAAARPRAPGALARASPAPTARPRPCRCSTRSCGRPACARVAVRQRRPADRRGGDGPRAVRRPRRRAVQLPAALHRLDVARESAAVLNVAEDHLDWYVGPDGMADYAADKGRIYERVAARLRLQRRRPGHRAAGPRGRRGRGRPRDRLHPRHARRRHGRRRRRRARRPGLRRGARRPAPPSSARSPTSPRPAPHFVANALAAAALARVARRARRPPCATGCAPSGPTATGSPRSPRSTASPGSTTPRPPTRTPPPSSLQAYDPVVWVAGGLAKGAALRRPRARPSRDRLRGVVLLGRDRAVIAEALARHAPDVPVIEVGGGETGPACPWTAWSGRPRAWPSQATPCCWPRDARPWTCSRTTAPAGTPSPRRCAGYGDR